MKLIYRIGAHSFKVLTQLAAFASNYWTLSTLTKARKRTHGAKATLAALTPTPRDKSCYWMHCASVGEFEQGRPVWETLIREHKNARFVLSFFSSSGYEQYVDQPKIGEVLYLPWDTSANVSSFIKLLRPSLALFVKYEWWLGFHEGLREAGIPYYIVSAAFRQNQPFFKWWGGAWKMALRGAKMVFVQNEDSKSLLERNGFDNAVVTGDTRLDRVLKIANTPFSHTAIDNWTSLNEDKKIIVAGSTWPPDEKLLAEALKALPNYALLVAPHEVGKKQIEQTLQQFAAVKPRLLSESTDSRVLIIDEIGLLARLYRYGDIAYVGGGFGAGIHNTLEPVAYKKPILFGPRHEKFIEAKVLVKLGVGNVVFSASAFVEACSHLEASSELASVLAKAEKYCLDNAGASQKISAYLQPELVL